MSKFAPVVDFIRDKYNNIDGFIPLHEPRFIGNEKKYLLDCIDSTFVSSVGEYVDRFEIEIAKFTGARKAVVCVNGTNALYLALKLVGVEQEDEVITQPLTFIATANAIRYCGANPIFIDIDKETLGLSPGKLEVWLSKNVEVKEYGIKKQLASINKNTGNRISAIVPMHTFGHPNKIDEIALICKKYNIPLVEDAAESMGSYYKGKHTGTFGTIGVLSFNGNKIITTGGGGMLLFNDEKLAKKAKHLTIQAKIPHQWEFKHDEIGYNYRMPNINAALGCAQLENLPTFLAAKRKLAYQYNLFFKQYTHENLPTFITEPQDAKSNYWLNAVLLANRKERDEFLQYTNNKQIMTRPVWELMNKLPIFKGAIVGEITNAQFVADRLVNIPSSVIIEQ